MEHPKQKNYHQAFDLACALLREKDLKDRAALYFRTFPSTRRDGWVLCCPPRQRIEIDRKVRYGT